MEIKVPQNLSLNNAINFCNRLWQLEDDELYSFNFINLGRVEPFTMAYVAEELKRFTRTKPHSKFQATHIERHTYAAHMGFFRAFGVKYGNEPGQANGSSTYIPLSILSLSELESEADERFTHVNNVVESKSEEIAQMLTQMTGGDLVDILTFSIREIMRNVVEHSQSESIRYCAQFWPTKSLVEVAILDSGTGVKHALASNPYLNISSERDAIQYALLPGVSGKMYKGVRRRPNDEWQNSGFGLYMTSRICRNGGNFFIASNNSGLLLNASGKHDHTISFKGTALRLRIDTRKITSCSDLLSRFRNEGDAAAKRFAGDDAIEPSVASTMLARDFS